MKKLRVLSICCGMGLLDRAFLDEGFDVTPGCEIDPDQRGLYSQLCGGEPLCHDLTDLPDLVRGQSFDLVMGGPPCQSLTKLRSMRAPKFADLSGLALQLLASVSTRAWLFENVRPLDFPRAFQVPLDAMHYGNPHQSRRRWFTFSQNLLAPEAPYAGTVNSLMAYPVVAGRLYGPKRGAILQGYPDAARLKAPCVVLQKGLANAVHYGLARAWAKEVATALR